MSPQLYYMPREFSHAIPVCLHRHKLMLMLHVMSSTQLSPRLQIYQEATPKGDERLQAGRPDIHYHEDHGVAAST